MADPFSIGLTILGAASSLIQGAAAANAANYNAQVQDQEAKRARQEGAAATEQSVRRSRQVLGAQKAAIAQSGFGFTGSLGDVATTSAINADLDALTLAYEGEAAARGHANKAQLYRMEAKNARTAGFLGAGTALFKGATRGYGRTYNTGFGTSLTV